MKKNVSNKKPHNKWKITAIISLVLNGLIVLLLVIGFSTPKVEKASAYLGYDNSKIITSTQKIDSNIDYYLYFDWDNHYLTDGLYQFVTLNQSDNIPAVNVGINIPASQIVSRGGHSINQIRISHPVNSDYLGLYAVIYSNGHYTDTIPLYRININNSSGYNSYIESVSYSVYPFLEEYDFYSLFRDYFNGSLSLTERDDFVIGYFSQYSVQVLSLKTKFEDYQNLFNSIYFESEYQFGYHEEVDIRFLQSTLFLSVGQPYFDSYNTSYDDWGYQMALRGLFKVDDNFYTGLAWVWKEFDLRSFYAVTYNNFMISRGISTNHYYYLDRLCPYDGVNEQVIYDLPLFIFHNDSYINENDYSGGLRMTLACQPVNANYINGINLYPSQQLWWSNLTSLFEVKNYFSFYNGEVSIETPIDTDITSYSGGNIGNVFVLISGAFESLIPILSIVILPGITLGMLVFIPIIAIVIIVVIKLVKR